MIDDRQHLDGLRVRGAGAQHRERRDARRDRMSGHDLESLHLSVSPGSE
ncbi:hypothetical protein [Burkholderia mallei]|nr:hypothetical protein [Burkholderia mallei]